MVARLVYEITEGIDEDSESARVLYTGTCRRYLREAITRFGRFKHDTGSDVHLSKCAVTAAGYAVKRSQFYNDSPVVLVVDTEKLDGDLQYFGEYRTRALNVGSFLPYRFTLNEDGRADANVFAGIRELKKFVIESSELEINRRLMNFLSASFEVL